MKTEKQPQLLSACQAGLAYFAGVFALAFVLGVLRRMLLVPTLGELGAVLAEIPVLLVFSWIVSRRITVRMDIPARWSERVLMGGVAFGLLMTAEFGLSILAFGTTALEYLASFRSLQGIVGLLGQILFAVIPGLQILSGSAASPDSTAPPR